MKIPIHECLHSFLDQGNAAQTECFITKSRFCETPHHGRTFDIKSSHESVGPSAAPVLLVGCSCIGSPKDSSTVPPKRSSSYPGNLRRAALTWRFRHSVLGARKQAWGVRIGTRSRQMIHGSPPIRTCPEPTINLHRQFSAVSMGQISESYCGARTSLPI